MILAGYDRVSDDLHWIIDHASKSDLHRKSAGTKWTNEQLLFHMVFGFMIVAALRNLVRVVAILPAVCGRVLARSLDAGTVPFDWINYQGSRYATLIFNHQRMAAKLDKVLTALARSLEEAPVEKLAITMNFPMRWDPFFREEMSLIDTFAYPIDHYDFHRKQLSLEIPAHP